MSDPTPERGRETPRRQSLLRAACPRCGKYVVVRLDGHPRRHGPRHRPCPGDLSVYHGGSEGLGIKPGGFFARLLEGGEA